MAMGTGMDTSMDVGTDSSTGSSLELLQGAGEGAVGPGCGYGARLWVWSQAVGMGPPLWLVAGMAGERGCGHQEAMTAVSRVRIMGRQGA